MNRTNIAVRWWT